MQPEEVMMQAYAKPKKEGNKFGLVIAMGIMLFVAALAGIVFGVYEMMMRNSEVEEAKAECAKQIEEAKGTGCGSGTKEVPTITNEVAQTMIEPYTVPFVFLANIFNYDFTEDVKIEIAYLNLRYAGAVISSVDSVSGSVKVLYDALNTKYKELFGGQTGMPRGDYTISHGDSFSYKEENGQNYYVVNPYQGGGAGSGMFDIVKSAEYDEDGNVIITVYHDVVSVCGTKTEVSEDEEAEYCLDLNKNSAMIHSVDEYNMKELIEKFEKDIPKYKMKFVKHNGKYVLNDVSKL